MSVGRSHTCLGGERVNRTGEERSIGLRHGSFSFPPPQGLWPNKVGLLVDGQTIWNEQVVERTEGGALVVDKVKKSIPTQRGTIDRPLSQPLTSGWNWSKVGV